MSWLVKECQAIFLSHDALSQSVFLIVNFEFLMKACTESWDIK